MQAGVEFKQLENQSSHLEKCDDIDITLKLNQISKSAPIKGLRLDEYDPIIIYFKDVNADFMKTIELIIG